MIDANKTGLAPPGDIPFEESGKPGSQQPGTPVDKKKTKRAKAKPNKATKVRLHRAELSLFYRKYVVNRSSEVF